MGITVKCPNCGTIFELAISGSLIATFSGCSTCCPGCGQGVPLANMEARIVNDVSTVILQSLDALAAIPVETAQQAIVVLKRVQSDPTPENVERAINSPELAWLKKFAPKEFGDVCDFLTLIVAILALYVTWPQSPNYSDSAFRKEVERIIESHPSPKPKPPPPDAPDDAS